MANNQNNRNAGKGLKDLSIKQMGKESRSTLLMAGGVVTAFFAKRRLDKLMEKNEAVSGLLGLDKAKFMKIVSPGIVAITGLGLQQLVRNKDLKTALMGVATGGFLGVANVFIKKDLLSGLEGLEGEALDKAITQVAASATPMDELAPLQLDLPEYEIEDEPMDSGRYIDPVVQQAPPPPVPSRETLLDEETEVNLESNRPEDNYEMEKPQDDTPGEPVSGTLEAIILPEEEPLPQPMYTRQEFDEELDFSNIP